MENFWMEIRKAKREDIIWAVGKCEQGRSHKMMPPKTRRAYSVYSLHLLLCPAGGANTLSLKPCCVSAKLLSTLIDCVHGRKLLVGLT